MGKKGFSQVLKTIAVNSFIGYRIFQRYDLLETDETLKSLDRYRERSNNFQATVEFIDDVGR